MGFSLAVVGGAGSGKSTICRSIAGRYSKKRNILVVLPDDDDTIFKDYESLKPSDMKFYTDERFCGNGMRRKLVFNKRLKHDEMLLLVRNTLVIMDDFRFYSQSNRDDNMRSFLARRRQKQRDVILVGHSPAEIPPSYYRWVWDIIVLPCELTEADMENRPKREELILAAARANETKSAQKVRVKQ